MAKPIEAIKPLRGKAAACMISYLKNAKPDPKKAKRAAQDRAFVQRHIKPLRP